MVRNVTPRAYNAMLIQKYCTDTRVHIDFIELQVCSFFRLNSLTTYFRLFPRDYFASISSTPKVCLVGFTTKLLQWVLYCAVFRAISCAEEKLIIFLVSINNDLLGRHF